MSTKKKRIPEFDGLQQKYREVLDAAGDAIFIAEAETGVILEANSQAERLIGLPLEKLIGMHQSELHPPNEQEEIRRGFKNVASRPLNELETNPGRVQPSKSFCRYLRK